MRKLTLFSIILISVCLMAPMAFAQGAYANRVNYGGQGLLPDDFGGYDLRTELCGLANGADAEGPYLLWVVTATKASKVDITGPWGTEAMTKSGSGTWKYVSGWYDPDTLPGNVYATYNGGTKNAQLVISHGCRPYVTGAWCSPGFWHNATDAAWALTGKSKSDLFNLTVFDVFYGATYEVDPTIYTVLTTRAGTYKGAPVPGTSGHELNAFNATGAYLTDNIPGYRFDWDVMQSNRSDACPIDHFGNFK
jgi:hypothetical protein